MTKYHVIFIIIVNKIQSRVNACPVATDPLVLKYFEDSDSQSWAK